MAGSKKFREVRSKKKPTIRWCDSVTDALVADELDEQRQALQRLRARSDRLQVDEQLKVEVESAEEELEERIAALRAEDLVVRFHARTIGRDAFERLVDLHPPTKDQQKQEGRKLSWNTDTFAPALIFACGVDVEKDEQGNIVSTSPAFEQESEAIDLWNDPDWNQGELGQIFQTCLDANTHIRKVDLGKG